MPHEAVVLFSFSRMQTHYRALLQPTHTGGMEKGCICIKVRVLQIEEQDRDLSQVHGHSFQWSKPAWSLLLGMVDVLLGHMQSKDQLLLLFLQSADLQF